MLDGGAPTLSELQRQRLVLIGRQQAEQREISRLKACPSTLQQQAELGQHRQTVRELAEVASVNGEIALCRKAPRKLHALIPHLGDLAPSWLPLDANWQFTRQAQPFVCHLRKVVAVGRLK
jgi:hypothetical protein